MYLEQRQVERSRHGCDAHPVLAAGLGSVERRVRGTQHLGDALAMLWVAGDADADGDGLLQGAALDVAPIERRHGAADALCLDGATIELRLREDEAELFAAVARREVRMPQAVEARFEQLRDAHQHLVAGGVAMTVVDQL